MSTKTSFKRIAAVAAVALTLGGLSAVSANAAPLAASYSTDFAASSIALGQDAVLVLHQDFTAAGAAGTDTQTMTFTVTGNAYGSTDTVTNSTWPSIFLGSDKAKLVSGTATVVANAGYTALAGAGSVVASGTAVAGTSGHTANADYVSDTTYANRGYASTTYTAGTATANAAGTFFDGFAADDIANGFVNVSNTQTKSGSGTVQMTVNNVNAGGAGTHTRGFERIQWRPTAPGTYSLKVTNSLDALWSYTWTFTVSDPAAAATAAATAATTLASATGKTPSATFSTAYMGYSSCTAMYAGWSTTGGICDTYGNAGTRALVAAPDQSVYYSKNLTAANNPISAASVVGTVNSTLSTAVTADTMNGAYVFATISGPGILQFDDVYNSYSKVAQGRGIAEAIATGGNKFQLDIMSDGTSGVATVNIYASASLAGTQTLIATKTVSFYGTAAKVAASSLVTAISGDTGAATPFAASVQVTDADGILIPQAQLAALGYKAYLVSDNTAVISNPTTTNGKSNDVTAGLATRGTTPTWANYVAATATGATVTGSKDEALNHTIGLTPVGGYYGTVGLTVKVTNDTGTYLVPTGFSTAAITGATAVAANTLTSNAWSVVVSRNAANSFTVAADQASYSPGAKGVLTFTALDADGRVVPDRLVLNVVTGSTVATSVATQNSVAVTDFGSIKQIGDVRGTTTNANDTVVTAPFSNGVTTLALYAPVVSGDFTLSMTLGTGFKTTGTLYGTTITKTLNVGVSAATQSSIDASQAAQDAANEATDAANAATDAANNAMDSADAAQQAAMDAGDKADAALAAVTDLASKVSEIAAAVTALSSVVSKIAAAVAKISKKVKA